MQETAFISDEHTQEFRFGIVHPIPAFHRKPCIKSKVKTPADSYVAGRLKGEHLELKIHFFDQRDLELFLRKSHAGVQKDSGAITHCAPVRSAQLMRAHAPRRDALTAWVRFMHTF